MSSVSVAAIPRPIPSRAVACDVPAGLSVQGIIETLGLSAQDNICASIGGVEIKPEFWHQVKPKDGSQVTIDFVFQGGEGGGKQILRIVATLALFAFTAGTGVFLGVEGLGLTGFELAAANLVGTLAINALIPLPTPGNFTGPSGNDPTAFSVSARKNRANLYNPIPQILGKHKVFPPYAAQPFTEIQGDDQFLRLMFTFGFGPLDITELKIGDTPIDNFQGVEYEIREGSLTDAPLDNLYSNDVDEVLEQIALTAAGGPRTRVTSQDTEEVIIDVTLNGLVEITEDGAKLSRTVVIEIEHRPVGGGGFTAETPLTITDRSTSLVRRARKISLAKGQYEIRLTRQTADSTLDSIQDETFWTALRSVKFVDPANVPGLSKVAIRVKATDQLNGRVDNFNAVVQTKALDWNGSSWVPDIPTSNPASLYRMILQGLGNKQPVSDSRLDLLSLQAWHQENTAARREFNAVYDNGGSIFERLKDVCAVGRAAFNMLDGKFSAVRDQFQSIPRQVFTPRNSSGFIGNKPFFSQPNALRVKFVNKDAGYTQDEITVYDDSFNEDNAELFETITLNGITDSTQAHNEGRYHIAVGRLRGETYTITTSVENVICTKGDLVLVTHDVPLFGVGQGRIIEITVDGVPNVLTIELDELLSIAENEKYSFTIRLDTGEVITVPIDTPSPTGEYGVFTLTTPDPRNIQPGDLAVLGIQSQETVRMIVKEIVPKADLTATLILVDEAPGVYTADTQPIPPFTSQITIIPNAAFFTLLAPTIERVRTEFILSGDVYRPRIVMSMGPTRVRQGTSPPDIYQVEFRETPTTDPDVAYKPLPQEPATSREIQIRDVDENTSYDIRVRYINSVSGRVSEFVVVNSHATGSNSDLAPADVSGLRIEDTFLSWDYPDPLSSIGGFRIKFLEGAKTKGDFPAAGPAHQELVRHTQYDVNQIISGQAIHTFFVVAVDTSGNESVNPAIVVTNIGEDLELLYSPIYTEDFKAAGFPGTLVNAIVGGGGNIEANVQAAPLMYTGTDSTPMYTEDPTASFYFGGTVYEGMSYTLVFTPRHLAENTIPRWTIDSTILGKNIFIEYGPQYPESFYTDDSKLLYDKGDSEPFYGGVEGQLRQWPGAVRNIVNQPYTMRITTDRDEIQGIISKLIMEIAGRLHEERIENFAIGVGGTRLTLGLKYEGISQIGDIAIQGTGGAVTVKVIDKDAVNGPLLEAFDSGGSSTSAVIDATIKGFSKMATTLPADGVLGGTPTEGTFKTEIENLRDFVQHCLGGGAEETLTIATGDVTPAVESKALYGIDTEGAATTDELDHIITTNTPTGTVLIIRPADDARFITVKHETVGAGQISLADGEDLILSSTKEHLVLKRVGADWIEIDRALVGPKLRVQPSPTLSKGDWIYHNGTKFIVADNTALGTSRVIGVVTEDNASYFRFAGNGERVILDSGVTAGAQHWLSTSGAMTTTKPTGVNIARQVAFGLDATTNEIIVTIAHGDSPDGKGSVIKLGEATGSGVATLSITGLTGTYEQHIVIIRGVDLSIGTIPKLKVYLGGVLNSANYHYHVTALLSNATTFGTSVSGASASSVDISAVNVDPAEIANSWEVKTFQPSVSGKHVMNIHGVSEPTGATGAAVHVGGCHHQSSGVIDGYELSVTTGVLTAAEMTVYGLSR